jgi:N-acetylglucosaminyldiphosphoundecaprenol N-acetyl-beta-D-mannosaminyltransferase
VNDQHGVAMVLGVPVDDVTMEHAVELIMELVADGRARRRTHQIATVNVDFVVNALSDRQLLDILQRTSLSIPDGMPIVWGARLMGVPLRTRVTGADLITRLVDRSRQAGLTVSFFGAAPGVAQQAADLVSERYPGSRVIADSGPVIPRVAELEIGELDSLRAARPDICCVALGNPKQEHFIARFGDELGIPVMIGVGGSLDFLVGVKRRAPAWMQRAGLEWMYRMLTEPRRLAGRYTRDAFVFLPRVMRQVWRGRPGRRRGSVAVTVEATGSVTVDVSRLQRADNRTAAEIAGAIRAARRRGASVVVRGGQSALRSVDGLEALVSGAVER